MQHILVYGDSLSWGIIPNTRRRLPFAARWPGVLEQQLTAAGQRVRVIEDCLNGRRTVWDDPFKSGRSGLDGLEQRIEINSPLALVIVMLGTNDFQAMHAHDAWLSSQGMAAIVRAIRRSPVEPGMPVPELLVVAPPPIRMPKGPIAPKFAGGEKKCRGLAAALAEVARVERCRFFDAATVTTSSRVDGIHLDADQHEVLGRALAAVVSRLFGRRRATAARSSAGARSVRGPRPKRPQAGRRRLR
jgi:lysophospholipase L1-like esterase